MHAFRIVGSFVPIDIPAEGHLLGARLASIRDAVNLYAIGTLQQNLMPSAGFLEADRRHDLGALLRQTICRRPGIAVAIRHFHQFQRSLFTPHSTRSSEWKVTFEMVHLFLRPPLGDGRGRGGVGCSRESSPPERWQTGFCSITASWLGSPISRDSGTREIGRDCGTIVTRCGRNAPAVFD